MEGAIGAGCAGHVRVSRLIVAVLAAGAALVLPAAASAAEGDLDSSFGFGGKVATTFGAGAAGARAVAVDPQGRIVAAGSASNGSNLDFAVARYTQSGNLDPSFNGTGTARTPIGTANDGANAVAIDGQGRIVVAGASFSGSNDIFALARYNPDGALDTTFNGTGTVTVPAFAAGPNRAFGVAIDEQGRILAAGGAGSPADFTVVRFNPDGGLDTTFGGTGKVTTPVSSGLDLANAISIDGQGRIVLAGTAADSTMALDSAVARYNPDGTLDTSFGGTGKVTTAVSPTGDEANALAIDEQGRIVTAGRAFNGSDADWAVVRYNPDGGLDASLGGTGKVTTSFNTGPIEQADALAVDRGKIVVGGFTLNSTTSDDFALARYNADGSLDPAFGSGGKVTAPFSPGLSDDLGNGLAIDQQGRIVLAGSTQLGGGQFALARYIGDATPPVATIDSGPPDGGLTKDSTPTFGFSSNEAGSSFQCGADGLSAGCTSPFEPSVALSEGPHTFSLTATDRAGNPSAPATRTFTVDTRAPNVRIKGTSRIKTRKRKARERLRLKTSEPATLTCKLDKRKPKACGAKYRTPKLRLGRHKLTVTAIDAAGNAGSATKKITVVRRRQ